MYNLMVVDDEARVRAGLRKLIEWDKLGFQIVGDAESAQKALEIIDEGRVDVVLTDIIMPEMDGLELIHRIGEINTDIKTVILSGYGEFQYAQKALRLGAFDFLTKPVDFEELKRIFRNIKDVLDKEANVRVKQTSYVELGKDQFLNNLSKGFYRDQDLLYKKLEELNLDMNFDNYCVIRIHISSLVDDNNVKNPNLDYAFIKMEIERLLKEYLNQMGKNHIFNNDLHEISAVFNFTNKDECREVLDQLRERTKSSMNQIIHLGVGKTFKHILNIEDSYIEAGKALDYRIINKDSSVLYYEDVSTFFKRFSLVTNEMKSAIAAYLVLMDEENLILLIDKILDNECTSDQISINFIYDACIEIILTIDQFVSSFLGNTKTVQMINQITIKNVFEKESIQAIKELMNSYIIYSIETIRGSKDKSTGLIIENTKKYINEHFGEDITLSKISNVLYIHPNYLSKLFKNKTGENFIDYLTRVRIEKAKLFLKDVSLKIYEIAELTGFCNPKYFGMTFKKYAGVTPREFRDRKI